MRALALLALFLAWPAQAQQRQPANVSTLPTTSPQEFDLLDNTGKWLPFGMASGGVFLNVGREISPVAFGAKCDGVTDDTAALQAWAAATTDYAHLAVPGVCVFKGQITFPLVYGVTLEGFGHPGTLLYAGASATLDPVIQIGQRSGPAGCPAQGWAIKGLRVMSNTVMTAGDALRISGACAMHISDLTLGGNLDNGNHNWFNALHLDGGNGIFVDKFYLSGSGAALTVNGETGTGAYQFTDPFFSQGHIVNSLIGIHICGGVGGFFATQTDVLGNGTNVLIDRTCVSRQNTQITFGPEFASDATNATLYPTAPQIGVHMSDPGGPQTMIIYLGWLASANNQCFQFDAGTPDNPAAPPIVDFSGARIGNCQQSGSPPAGDHGGIENDSTYAQVNIAGTRFFTSRVGWPTVYNAAGAPAINIQSITADAAFNVSGSWVGAWQNGSVFTVAPPFVLTPSGATNAALNVTSTDGVNTGGSIRMTNSSAGATTPKKTMRVNNAGQFQLLNDALSVAALTVDDTGNGTFSGTTSATGFKIGSTAGFSGTKTAGTCVLTISGGIITNVTGC